MYLEGAFTVPEQPERVAISVTQAELRALCLLLANAVEDGSRPPQLAVMYRDFCRIERRKGWAGDE